MLNDKMTSSIYDTAVKHRELQTEIQKIFQTVVDGLNFCTLAHKVKILKSLIAPESVAILDEIQHQLDIHDEFRNLRSKLKSGKMI